MASIPPPPLSQVLARCFVLFRIRPLPLRQTSLAQHPRRRSSAVHKQAGGQGLAPETQAGFGHLPRDCSTPPRERHCIGRRGSEASVTAMSCQEMFDDVLDVLKAHHQESGFSDGVSQVEALQTSSKALRFSIAVIGEQEVGKTTLIDALRGHEVVYIESHLPSFFSSSIETSGPKGHVYPTFPNTVIWDLPAYSPTEKPAVYLDSINFHNYNILMLCVASSLTESDLQLLKTIKQKGKGWYVVRTKVDLAVHTCKRRKRTRYCLRDTLEELRKGCTEGLEKAGLGSDKVFLVSGLELEKYDFAMLDDALESEILNMKRNNDWSVEEFKWCSKKKLQEFYMECDAGGLGDLPILLQSALDTPINIRLDIAVIGEVGSGKSAFVNALRDLMLNEGEEAQTGVIETTQKPAAFPLLEVPNVYIWDLPGFGTSELPIKLFLKHLDLDQYDFFIIVASERYKYSHSCLVKAINMMGKKFFFVRSKIDSDLEASQKQRGRAASPNSDELLEKVRQSYFDVLKKEEDAKPEVFLVSSLDHHKFEMPQLREALGKVIPDLKRQALLHSLPALIHQVVRCKRKKLVKGICGKALQTCLYAIEKPGHEAIDTLVSTLSNYATDLGLDEDSQQRVAQATGKCPENLQAEIRCPLVKNINLDEILKLVSTPLPISSRVWNYIPYMGKVTPAGISLELTYDLLKSTAWQMSEDAERLLRKAYDIS
ncbi:interferon-inducible GTPase 5-like [Ambystoma mexicanum]|uniref:interferon-inducible GTPase 5-like n=1 Tax=Ambystoma mexicanum TaxID=8296 RepID=UPI0037E7301E